MWTRHSTLHSLRSSEMVAPTRNLNKAPGSSAQLPGRGLQGGVCARTEPRAALVEGPTGAGKPRRGHAPGRVRPPKAGAGTVTAALCVRPNDDRQIPIGSCAGRLRCGLRRTVPTATGKLPPAPPPGREHGRCQVTVEQNCHQMPEDAGSAHLQAHAAQSTASKQASCLLTSGRRLGNMNPRTLVQPCRPPAASTSLGPRRRAACGLRPLRPAVCAPPPARRRLLPASQGLQGTLMAPHPCFSPPFSSENNALLKS